MDTRQEQGHDFHHFIKQNDLLLHSLINFQELFEDIFDAIKPKSLCEVGVEFALFSQFLLKYCMDNSISYSGVDTDPNSFKIHQEYSFGETNVMSSLFYLKRTSTQCSDIYILDGDHNYYTVYNELKSIYRLSQRSGKPFPFIFLHDTSWPWDKRDLYYSVESLPKKKIHPYTNGGVTIHTPEAINGGFRGEGSFFVALKRGGEQNGVKTAINDFLEDITDISLKEFSIPAVFGLTMLFSPDAYDQNILEKIEKSFFPWEKLTSFLGRMEYNRLGLYLKVLELNDALCYREVQRQRSKK